MPITPLHFGINGAVASIFTKKIDIISAILANVLIDIQPFLVIFLGLNAPLHGISHTLIFALPVSAFVFCIYGLIVRKVFNSNKPISAFVYGGMLGAFLHILLDFFYHKDVLALYPFSDLNFAFLDISREIIVLCYISYIIFGAILFIKVINKWRLRKLKS